MLLDFFFNDTATTEIYTDGPTLSLHDALPIYVSSAAAAAPRLRAKPDSLRQLATLFGVVWRHHRIVRRQAPSFAILLRRHAIGRSQMPLQHLQLLAILQTYNVIRHHRSEEHTSELQSLMRISYAVFCLTKKTT